MRLIEKNTEKNEIWLRIALEDKEEEKEEEEENLFATNIQLLISTEVR